VQFHLCNFIYRLLAGEFARRAQRCSLTPDLTVFCIRVLEAALVHAQKFGSQTFEYKQEITDYLEELKSSGLSYREPPPPPKVKLKPGPKPKVKIYEHAGSKAYFIAEPGGNSET